MIKKTVICLIGLFLSLSISTCSAEMLASMKIEASEKNKALTVYKVVKDDGIYIEVENENGENIWRSSNLGIEDKSFVINGKARNLALYDFDKDGVFEIVTAAFYGPKASGLWIFKRLKNDSFEPVKNSFPDADITRDFLVSDVHRVDGTDFLIEGSGRIKTLGQIFNIESLASSTHEYLEFFYKSGTFIHEKNQ
ncbi:MAG: hypothetical protein HQM10_04145 [Candidatus Riflebacteria bacterium]|nr:hypothetical protein [Candidatus Riflebacteria bacterium]